MIGLEKREMDIIDYIHKNGGTIPITFAKEGICTYCHVIKIIRKMISKGVIERKRLNGRATMVYLTPKGVEMAKHLEKLKEAMECCSSS